MYADIFARFKEPTPDQFDAYFYDFDKPCFDFSILPDFLQELMPYPVSGSGTHKYQWIIYQLATRAKLAMECGVWEGGTTVPLALGLRKNGGRLVAIDVDLTRPALKQKVERYGIGNVEFLQMNDLEFTRPEALGKFDLIYIDSLHDHEHVVKQLFHFDPYLRKGGIFVLHDIVAYNGVGLVDAKEDAGYTNASELVRVLKDGAGRHISEYPVLVPDEYCLFSPIHFAVQTFLARRKAYRFFKMLDWCGMGFIWKQ
ncbi:MAG TPA: class I SAM-dependent methyltransferase [Bacteroidota bacterium]|nr:class I SAM-dependent methyltransferase [Bacteroidota bacterium]